MKMSKEETKTYSGVMRTKKARARVLDDFCGMTELTRKHSIKVLSAKRKPPSQHPTPDHLHSAQAGFLVRHSCLQSFVFAMTSPCLLGVGCWAFNPNFKNDSLERRGVPVNGNLAAKSAEIAKREEDKVFGDMTLNPHSLSLLNGTLNPSAFALKASARQAHFIERTDFRGRGRKRCPADMEVSYPISHPHTLQSGRLRRVRDLSAYGHALAGASPHLLMATQ